MAKQERRILPARKRETSLDDDSRLVRSAESLGRVIGSLQRQVRGGTKRMSSMTGDARALLPDIPRFDNVFGAARAGKSTNGRPPRARKAKSSPARTSSKSTSGSAAAARKTAASRKRTRAASKKR